MNEVAFRYVFYRVVSKQGRVHTGFSKLPVTDFNGISTQPGVDAAQRPTGGYGVIRLA